MTPMRDRGRNRRIDVVRAVIGLFLVAIVPGQARAQDPAEEFQDSPVVALEFVGVHNVDERVLRESIVTEATKCKSVLLQPFCWITSSGVFVEEHDLDRLDLERDELRLRIVYYRHGYRDASVAASVRPEEEGVAVTFTIEEGAPTRIRSIAVDQAAPVLSADEIAAAELPLEGEPVNLNALDSISVR